MHRAFTFAGVMDCTSHRSVWEWARNNLNWEVSDADTHTDTYSDDGAEADAAAAYSDDGTSPDAYSDDGAEADAADAYSDYGTGPDAYSDDGAETDAATDAVDASVMASIHSGAGPSNRPDSPTQPPET
jgi:hypothetical protein